MQWVLAGRVVASLMTFVFVSPAATETENRQQTEAIRKYLKENFGYPGMETSWYRYIAKLTVQGKKVVVETKINSKSTRKAASGICGGVSGYVFSNKNRSLGIEHIVVLGADGGIIVNRLGLSDRCEPR